MKTGSCVLGLGHRSTRFGAPVVHWRSFVIVVIALLGMATAHAACGPIPADYPVAGGTSIKFTDSKSAVTVGSSQSIAKGTYTTNTGVDPDTGAIVTTSATYPSLDPATFPTFSGGASQKFTADGTLAAGTWDVISSDKKSKVDVTFTGGTYYIKSFDFKDDTSLTLGPGDYYFETFSADKDFDLILSGPVRIFIKTKMDFKSKADVNKGGSVGNLAIFLYADAYFEAGKKIEMYGLVYGTTGADIKFKDKADLYGAAMSAGTVEFGKDADIFYSASTEAAIGALSTCATTVGSVDHYELSLPTSSIACLVSTATVTACTNAGSPCTASTAVSGATATLATSGGALGTTSVTFNASGVASTTLSYPAAANGASASVTLSGESTAATNARKCCPDGGSCAGGSSCSTIFTTSGFIVSSVANGASVSIPTQTAGTSSGTYWLRAVKSGTTTKACEAAVSGATAVNLAYQCNNPTTCYSASPPTCGGSTGYLCLTPYSSNGVTAQTAQALAANPNSGVSSYNSVTMNFDADGNAPFSFVYQDVGALTLSASKAASGALLTSLTGATNSFVVKPSGFVISGIQQTAAPQLVNPAAASAAGAKFVKAGESFTATVTATASGGATTPSYGRESSPEGVLLTRALVLPSGGAPGTLANATIAGGSFQSGVSKGVATVTDLSWDEVGIITLTPSVGDASYLGAGNVSGASSGNVGRFYPDHFAITSPALTPACSTGATPFTYFGQDGFTTAFTLTAQSVSNNTTTNYAGSGNSASWAKLPLTVWAAAPASAGSPGFGFGAIWLPAQPAGASLAASATTLTASNSNAWLAGTTTVTAKHKVVRPTAAAMPTTLTVTSLPVDSDGVTLATATAIGSPLLRFGRLWLGNVYGSDKLPMSMPYQIQYWNGFAFVKNADDVACTTLSTSNLGLGNYKKDSGINSATMGVAKFSVGANVGGGGAITISAPDSAAAGSVDLVVALGSAGSPANCVGLSGGTAASPSLAHLSGKWCDSNYDRDPTARATFGVFGSGLRKGPVYIRENF